MTNSIQHCSYFDVILLTCSQSSEEGNVDLQHDNCPQHKSDSRAVDVPVDLGRIVGKKDVVAVNQVLQAQVHQSCHQNIHRTCFMFYGQPNISCSSTQWQESGINMPTEYTQEYKVHQVLQTPEHKAWN